MSLTTSGSYTEVTCDGPGKPQKQEVPNSARG